jgi:CBS domain-containing protein
MSTPARGTTRSPASWSDQARRISHLAVLEGRRLAGIVNIGDVVKYNLDEAKVEFESLRDYVLADHCAEPAAAPTTCQGAS